MPIKPRKYDVRYPESDTDYDPQDAADILAENAPEIAPHLHSILEDDPGTFGAGRDDLFDRFNKAQAARGLQLANQRTKQTIDLRDPQLRREEQSRDIGAEQGMIANGGGDIDDYQAGLDAMRKFKLTRAEGQAQNQNLTDRAFSSTHDKLRHEAQEDLGTSIEGKIQEALAKASAKDGLTASSRQMSEQANDVLTGIGRVLPLAQKLHGAGLFTPGIGSLRQFSAEHGIGGIWGMGPEVTQDIGRFNTEKGLLMSAIARAHAGARGAGNKDMADRLEKLMNASGDMDTFLGELQGAENWMRTYAGHTNSNLGDPIVPVAGNPAAGGAGRRVGRFLVEQ